MSRTVSSSGLALIKKFEGFIAEPVQIGDGHWVVGHGHVRQTAPGAAVSTAEAEALLVNDLAPIAAFLNEQISTKITQSQFDALASFAFSIGLEAFSQSAVLRRVQAGQLLAAACAMEAWRKSEAGGDLQILGALVRRRAVEKAVFLKTGAQQAAPSAFLRPQMDHAMAILGAPVDYVATPVLSPAPQAAPSTSVALVRAVDPGVRITEILQSEPATAVLLLTQVVTDDEIDDDGELVTAHAKPVAHIVSQPASRKWWKLSLRQPVETFGLAALFAFGAGLMALGGVTLFSGSGDLIDVMGASALAGPGFIALAMAGLGFMRGPSPILAH